MTTKTALRNDVTKHLKAGNTVELLTVRNLLGEIEKREKAGKTPVELTEAEVISILHKEVAKRTETAATAETVGRHELAARERAEAEVITAYLPAGLTDAEAEALVDAAVAEVSAANAELSMRAMGQVMKLVQPQVAGRYDGKKLSEMVKAKLGV